MIIRHKTETKIEFPECLHTLHGKLKVLVKCLHTLHGYLKVLVKCLHTLHGKLKVLVKCLHTIHGKLKVLVKCLHTLHGKLKVYVKCLHTLHGKLKVLVKWLLSLNFRNNYHPFFVFIILYFFVWLWILNIYVFKTLLFERSKYDWKCFNFVVVSLTWLDINPTCAILHTDVTL